jgi:hypothetical protein
MAIVVGPPPDEEYTDVEVSITLGKVHLFVLSLMLIFKISLNDIRLEYCCFLFMSHSSV